ncbi:transposase [Paracoccus sp. MA]
MGRRGPARRGLLSAPGRAGENAECILQGCDGILQLDGYTGYNP